MKNRYSEAQKTYAELGIDTDSAIERLKNIPISMQCWQGDDIGGFDFYGGTSGGIQVTGNYPGKAVTHEQLMEDISMALSLVGGKHKLNLHASYAVFDEDNGGWVNRDRLEPKHYTKWVDFAKEQGIGLDFNTTFFSHSKAAGFTLSSNDEKIRRFWINHAVSCIKISEYFASELNQPCLLNIWIPDGLKDIPADRLTPRLRFKQSLDEIFETPYDKEKVLVSLESKVFGIGLESYTVGSSEFCVNYALKAGLLPLMDNGHYHPTESVADKISALLIFFDKIALHITRAVRWDSDHVVLFNDEVREIATEIIANDALDRVILALDFFDASINRISAWVNGMRNLQKALLYAMLTPVEKMRKLQEEGDFSELMTLREEIKTLPFGDVWNCFCEETGVAGSDWFEEIKKYEKSVLNKRKG